MVDTYLIPRWKSCGRLPVRARVTAIGDERITQNVWWPLQACPPYGGPMRRILVSTVLVISALTLAGCTAGGGSSSAVARHDAASPMQQKVASSGASATESAADSGRQEITTGTISLTVDAPARAADAATRIVETAGGRVDGRVEQAPTDARTASARLTIRIPSEHLTATIDRVKKLGRLESIDLAKQDVTAKAKDLEARITALRTSVDRLVDLMSKAGTTADLITIESALSDRQGNLESLASEKRSMDDRIDLSTVTLELGTAATAPARVPGTFLTGLAAGWDSFVGFLSGLLVVIGVLLPWVGFLGALALAALLVLRRIANGRARTGRARSDRFGADATAVDDAPPSS